MTQPPQEPAPEDQPRQSSAGGPQEPEQPPREAPQSESTPGQSPPFTGPQQPPPSGSPQQPSPYGGTYAQAGGQPPPPGTQESAYGGAPSDTAQTGYGYQYTDRAQGLAGRGARLAAALVDLIILAVINWILGLIFGQTVTWINNPDGTVSVGYSSGGVAGGLLWIAIFLAYFTILHSKWEGQTLGKRVLGIRVVREGDRGTISTGQALGRAAVYYFSWWVCVVGGIINLAWILWDPRRQALHDKVAKTVVANAKPGDPNPYRTGPF